MEWHTVSSDQKKANSDKLFVLWNGGTFVIPVTPTPVAELNTNLSNFEENFDEVKDLIKETIDMLPKSKIKKAFKEVQKMVESSSNLLISCKSSTGWAVLSLPKLSSVESAGSIAAPRIPTGRQPEKVKSFTTSVHHRKIRLRKNQVRVVSPSLLHSLRNPLAWKRTNVHVGDFLQTGMI